MRYCFLEAIPVVRFHHARVRSSLCTKRSKSRRYTRIRFRKGRNQAGIVSAQTPPAPTDDDNEFRDSVLSEIALGVAGLVLCAATNESALGTGLSLTPQLLGAAALGSIGLGAFSILVGTLNPSLRNMTAMYCKKVFVSRSIFDIACFCVVVSLGEELFFRSWLFQFTTTKYGLLPAQFISSTLFGICHGTSLALISSTAFAGYIFSCLFIIGGNSPLVPFIVHFVHNFISILIYRVYEAN